RLVEPKKYSGDQTQQRRGSDDRKHRNGAANRDRQRDFLRRDALRQLGNDRVNRALLPPRALAGCWVRRGFGHWGEAIACFVTVKRIQNRGGRWTGAIGGLDGFFQLGARQSSV